MLDSIVEVEGRDVTITEVICNGDSWYNAYVRMDLSTSHFVTYHDGGILGVTTMGMRYLDAIELRNEVIKMIADVIKKEVVDND